MHLIESIKGKGVAMNMSTDSGEALHPQTRKHWQRSNHQADTVEDQINQLEKQFYRSMSDNRVLSEKIIRLEARFDKMKNIEYSPGLAGQQCTPSTVERFNSLVGSLIDTVVESRGAGSSTNVRISTPELEALSLVSDPVVHKSAQSDSFVDVPLASLEGRKHRQRERLQRAKEAKASKHPVTPPVDTAFEDVVVVPSEFDTFDVHSLYDEVVPHSTVRVDDATDEFGRDILEPVVEEDGDPDWANE
ncbi:hypothetical protein BDM02DRAFT_3193134 [Thelephora ganbajun]|uniref:Uncharacterized protein n=1 Tax=Thelephora ganbajun TaxID=370292 RepID=A0ACB6YZI7_THEGA|nr:hypothetical protein BDM02DRAFT_3193134 [Thelephora ganbajun]